jgi:hypothetical protein
MRSDGNVATPERNGSWIRVIETEYPRRLHNSSGKEMFAIVSPRREAANNAGSTRNVVIFDDHPASRRLLRDAYLGPVARTFSQYCLVVIALLILALADAIVWFT